VIPRYLDRGGPGVPLPEIQDVDLRDDVGGGSAAYLEDGVIGGGSVEHVLLV
jgi:hypothetical protein